MKSLETRRKIGAASHKRWQDPKFRAKVIRKQRQLGYRTYPANRTSI